MADKNKHNPKVSVIMPVYNSEDYLPETLASITKQSLKDIEIICVDDGSTDSSSKIVEGFMKNDERIKLIRQDNQYAGVARNAGMVAARGEYLMFLDSDDLFDEEMAEKAYRVAKENMADVLIFGGKEFQENPELSQIVSDYARKDIVGDKVINAEMLPDKIFSITNPAPWNKLFRKSFIEENDLRYERCKRGNDIFFVYMAIAIADRIAVIDDELIYYRRNVKDGLQSTKSESPGYFVKPFLNIRKELIKRNRFQVLECSFCRAFLSNCFFNLDYLDDENSFKALYSELKENVFVELDIDEVYKRNHFSEKLYQKYRFILENDFTAYGLHGLGCESRGKGNYPFPFFKIEKGKSTVIYGAGKVGQAYYVQAVNSDYFSELWWVDRNCRVVLGTGVLSPESVDYSSVDYVIIAVTSAGLKDEITSLLIDKFHVANNKIIWEDPNK